MGAEIAGVGILGYLAERHLFATPGEEDRHARLLDWPGHELRVSELIDLAVEGEFLARPEPGDDFKRLLHRLLALRHGREGDAHLGELFRFVADAEAKNEP